MTNGFIIGPKKEFKEDSFLKANYGDYFVYLMKDLEAKIHQLLRLVISVKQEFREFLKLETHYYNYLN